MLESDEDALLGSRIGFDSGWIPVRLRRRGITAEWFARPKKGPMFAGEDGINQI